MSGECGCKSNQWICVEDDLPKKERGSIYSRAVLSVNIEDGCIFVSTYISDKKSWCNYYGAPNGYINPQTHWMELPKLPI